jgi:AcrR family transcriptional regulator
MTTEAQRYGTESAASLSPAGLRERKKLRTKAALVDAALDLFERHGFDATTVDQIAAAVDISPRTFFRYFATKEDVVLSYKETQTDEIMELLRQRPPDEPVFTALRRCAEQLLGSHLAGDMARLRRCALLARHTPALLARDLEREAAMERKITIEIARRLRVDPDGDLRPRLIVGVAIAVMRAVGDAWTSAACEGAPVTYLRSLFDQAFSIVEAGLNLSPADVAH